MPAQYDLRRRRTFDPNTGKGGGRRLLTAQPPTTTTTTDLQESYDAGDCTDNYAESGPVDVACTGCDYARVYTCTCSTDKTASTFLNDCDTIVDDQGTSDTSDDVTYGIYTKFRYDAKHPSGDSSALEAAWTAYIESRAGTD